MNKYNPHIHHRRSIRLKGYDYAQEGLYFITICCENRICRFGKIENGEMILNDFGVIAYNEWMKLSERFPNFELDVFQIMPNHMHGIIVLNTVGATLAVAPNDGITQNDGITKNDGIAPNDGITQNDGNSQNNAIQNNAIQNNAIQNNAIQNNAIQNNAIQNDAIQNDAIQNDAIQNDAIQNDAIQNDAIQNDAIQNDAQPDDDMRATARVAPTVSDIVGAYKSLVANGCLEIYKTRNETMGKLWQRNYYEHIIRNEQSYQTISNYIINNPAKWAEDKFNLNNV